MVVICTATSNDSPFRHRGERFVLIRPYQGANPPIGEFADRDDEVI